MMKLPAEPWWMPYVGSNAVTGHPVAPLIVMDFVKQIFGKDGVQMTQSELINLPNAGTYHLTAKRGIGDVLDTIFKDVVDQHFSSYNATNRKYVIAYKPGEI
jgi:hypothetical protein